MQTNIQESYVQWPTSCLLCIYSFLSFRQKFILPSGEEIDAANLKSEDLTIVQMRIKENLNTLQDFSVCFLFVFPILFDLCLIRSWLYLFVCMHVWLTILIVCIGAS